MSAPFEERSGLVPCATPWGCWYQTMEEVVVEVAVPQGTRAREVECSLKSRYLELAVAGKEVLKGKLFDSTIADEATWTLEDQKLIRIVLTKTNRDAGNCWSSLLVNEYSADPWVQDQMQRKLTLERFQREVHSHHRVASWRAVVLLGAQTEASFLNEMSVLLAEGVLALRKLLPFMEEASLLFVEGALDSRNNPGFDFSGAEISGNYSKGGPDFSSLER